MDYRALLNGMSANSSTKAEVSVTITEGMNLSQIFALMEERGVASEEDLMEQAANYDYAFDFLQDIPLGDANRLEASSIPTPTSLYPTTPSMPSTRCWPTLSGVWRTTSSRSPTRARPAGDRQRRRYDRARDRRSGPDYHRLGHL